VTVGRAVEVALGLGVGGGFGAEVARTAGFDVGVGPTLGPTLGRVDGIAREGCVRLGAGVAAAVSVGTTLGHGTAEAPPVGVGQGPASVDVAGTFPQPPSRIEATSTTAGRRLALRSRKRTKPMRTMDHHRPHRTPTLRGRERPSVANLVAEWTRPTVSPERTARISRSLASLASWAWVDGSVSCRP